MNLGSIHAIYFTCEMTKHILSDSFYKLLMTLFDIEKQINLEPSQKRLFSATENLRLNPISADKRSYKENIGLIVTIQLLKTNEVRVE